MAKFRVTGSAHISAIISADSEEDAQEYFLRNAHKLTWNENGTHDDYLEDITVNNGTISEAVDDRDY
jgi:hypothetical protein